MIKTGISWLNNPFKVMRHKYQQCGTSFDLTLPQLGQVLVTGDPSHIKQIVNCEEYDAGIGVRALTHILGSQSVICLDGALHKQRHQLLTHYFYSDKIYALDDMLRIKCQEMLSVVELHSRFNFYSFSQSALLEIALIQILGDIDPILREAVKSTLESIHAIDIHPAILFVKPLQQKCWGYSSWGKLLLHQQKLRLLLQQTIKNHTLSADDLLSYLLQHGSTYYDSEDALIDELMALLFFSHETTAASIAAIADFLLRYETPSDKLRDVAFLQSCIKEGMRLRPVVPHLTRISKDTHNLSGYRLKKGQWVFPSSYLAHLNSDVFPHPECFMPERFSSGKSYPFNCFPFGIGQRMCIGKRLAERHMEIILQEIFSALTFAKPTTPLSDSRKHLVLMLPSNLSVATVISNS